ncbi:Hypothetical predicted protein [Lecanosticta acicola]|uniref:Uncharacterized protein n=1 Tax=Lecanosticta acicola TaxID=111012 RepID=A0AAI9E533_9PEZI|nr:Hypothetical predicted protein [Lecanosticta acicola]
MAQPPTSTSSPAPQIQQPQQQPSRSHGRGGAGNINSTQPTALNANDLQTPTIKGTTYTTGRGGSGNMASNNPSNPFEARAAQDVDTPLHHNREMSGTYHWGRGGEGNMTTLGPNSGAKTKDSKGTMSGDAVKEKLSGRRESSKERPGIGAEKKERTLSQGSENGAGRRPSLQGVLNRGREMLGLSKNKAGGEKDDPVRQGSVDESAIAE